MGEKFTEMRHTQNDIWAYKESHYIDHIMYNASHTAHVSKNFIFSVYRKELKKVSFK